MFNNSSIIQSPEMFLKNSIERIISDSSIKRKENAKLKKTCESALGLFIVLYKRFFFYFRTTKFGNRAKFKKKFLEFRTGYITKL